MGTNFRVKTNIGGVMVFDGAEETLQEDSITFIIANDDYYIEDFALAA